ncbi:MAG: DUF2130 domain-containing protein [Nitrospirae bacterium]|nr:DUF2130 domain-containing protein [Nitrospirota bacterium]
MEQTILCPHCNKEIPLTETLSHQIREGLQKEFEIEARERELAITKREKQVAGQLREIEVARNTVAQQVAEQLKIEETKLRQTAKAEAESAMKLELKDLQGQIASKDQRLKESQNNELELRKKARELDDRQKSLELEVARKIDEEREKIRDKAVEQFTENHRMKDLEKDKQLDDMRKTIDDLKRKAEQGSMQTQGEVLELDIEVLLKTCFPFDCVEPVSKGMRGADILQRVISSAGQNCGTIIWETKRTKAWSDGWIEKLKNDQREVRAEIAVIVTEALPKGMHTFGEVEGIWVTTPAIATHVAALLRSTLIQVNQATLSITNKDEKMELLYNYLSGPSFRHKVEAIVEAFVTIKADLDKEKRATTKMWAKRERQIEKVIMSTSGMYGDMQGIIGSSLPEIKMLDLEASSEDVDAGDEEII